MVTVVVKLVLACLRVLPTVATSTTSWRRRARRNWQQTNAVIISASRREQTYATTARDFVPMEHVNLVDKIQIKTLVLEHGASTATCFHVAKNRQNQETHSIVSGMVVPFLHPPLFF